MSKKHIYFENNISNIYSIDSCLNIWIKGIINKNKVTAHSFHTETISTQQQFKVKSSIEDKC